MSVTLAAALALPLNFPQRDLLVFAAFAVVLGTLLIQGMTLRPLLSILPIPADDTVGRELKWARHQVAQAALDSLGEDRGTEAGRLLVQEYEARLNDGDGQVQDATGIMRLRRRMARAERACLVQLRDESRIGDHAFHEIEEQLDWIEAELEVVAPDP